MNRHYYNEFDPRAAAWLRELMGQKLIPQGVIDERDIRLVTGSDLAGFTQCHFFAGIGGWPLALQLAHWPEQREVWTGSCPCQPFSVAGKKKGKRDPRHLWPEFKRLIGERKPAIVFGEQVASKAGRLWLDGVFADLEALEYAVAGADLCAAGIGAPHIRQRLFWMAESKGEGWSRVESEREGKLGERTWTGCESSTGGMANSNGSGRLRTGSTQSKEWQSNIELARPSEVDGMEHANGSGCGEQCRPEPMASQQPGIERASGDGRLDDASSARTGRRSSTEPISDGTKDRISRSSGAWSDFDIIPCRDGKSRRVEAGTFPLADGFPGRVGILRGYGNAIVPQLAAEFIQACVEALK